MIEPAVADRPLRALVLTAGLGTRLEPLTYVRAKAAVPVNGETLARRVIRWLVSQGVKDLVLNLHHLPASITGSVGDGSDLDARVRYSWENPVLGSAGGPRRALPLLMDRAMNREPEAAKRQQAATRSQDPAADSQQPFLIVNGDTLTDLDIAAMMASHTASGAAVTMAVIPNPRPEKYGGVVVEDGRWVKGFTRAAAGQRSYHFVGVQIAGARAFESVPEGVPSETVNGIYPVMIASDPHSIGAFVCDASFRDIGTPSDYLDTSTHLARVEGDQLLSARRVEIAATASIVRTAVWDDVRIGERAELIDCIICDGAVVPAGARYQRCAIVPAAGRSAKGRQRIEGDLLLADF
jgi:NDP-sugar pyrophosphorylase family protein